MDRRFERTEKLIGRDALERLAGAHVAVFGLGGVGSYAVEALARAGVGELTLIDNDAVSLTNINRQLYALGSTLGEYKTEVAKRRVLDINPECAVNVITEFYLPESAEKFFAGGYSYIIDAIDTVTAKIDLAVRAAALRIPIISCMGTGNKLNPLLFEVADIYETSVCPLCRVMRYELRKRGIERLKVVFSKEPPAVPDNSIGERNVPSSISFVPPAAGLLLAGEAVKELIIDN